MKENTKRYEIAIYDKQKESPRPSWGEQWDIETFDLVLSERQQVIQDILRTLSGLTIGLIMGVGKGVDVNLISEVVRHVIAIDISAEQIRYAHAKQSFEGVSYIISDVENPCLRSNTIGVIWCRGILHHLPNLANAIRSFRNALETGGKLVLIEPGQLNPVAIIARRFFPTDIHTPGEQPFIPSRLVHELNHLGFQELRFEKFVFCGILIPVLVKWIPQLKKIATKIIPYLSNVERSIFCSIKPISNLCWQFVCMLELIS